MHDRLPAAEGLLQSGSTGCFLSGATAVPNAAPPEAHSDDIFSFLASLSSSTPPPVNLNGAQHWSAGSQQERGVSKAAQVLQLLSSHESRDAAIPQPSVPAAGISPTEAQPQLHSPPHGSAPAPWQTLQLYEASSVERGAQHSKAS